MMHDHNFEQVGETLRFSSGYDESLFKCAFCEVTMRLFDPYREETQ